MLKKLMPFFIILFTFTNCKKDSNTSIVEEMAMETAEEITIAKDLKGSVSITGYDLNNYKVISELDESSIDEDGNFNIGTHGVLLVSNTVNNEPVYFGISQNGEEKFVLDAKETALYFALLGIPHIRRPGYRVNISNFKKALYELREVRELEQAIQESIKEFGFLNYERINKELGDVATKVTLELDILKTDFNKRSVNWNSNYSAGRGFFRVDDEIPNNWEDKYDEATKTYRLKRRFYNQSGAVIGIRIEKYNNSKDGVELPFKGKIIGFVSPYYPPDLLSVNGSLENLKSFVEQTTDILTNGWDGFANTDAYSSYAELEFDAKKGEKDAIVFSNGFYEPETLSGVNIMFLFLDNFTDLFKLIGDDKLKLPKVYTNQDFVLRFATWMVENNALTLQNYRVWFKEFEFELIVNDLKQKLFDYLTIIGNEEGIWDDIDDASKSFLAEEIIGRLQDKMEKYIDKTMKSVGKFYKASRITAKAVGAYIVSESPKFNAAIPIEFDEITYPPQAFRPDPINIQLENLSGYNFNWQVDGEYTSDIYFAVYFGTSAETLDLIGTTPLNGFQYKINNLKSNTRYYWQVESFYQNGKSSKSAIWTFDNGLVSKDCFTDVFPLPEIKFSGIFKGTIIPGTFYDYECKIVNNNDFIYEEIDNSSCGRWSAEIYYDDHLWGTKCLAKDDYDVSFSINANTSKPSHSRIVLRDAKCGKRYESNVLDISLPSNCSLEELKSPKIKFLGKVAFSNEFYHYRFELVNFNDFSYKPFNASSNCSVWTMEFYYDNSKYGEWCLEENYYHNVYQFKMDDLQPTSGYIIMENKECNTKIRSNTIYFNN